MPNAPGERQRFKVALAKIVKEYGDWINDNRHLQNLMRSTESKFDEIIHFESPGNFTIVLMGKDFQANEGCSVAAMTLSKSNDDMLPNYQREIYYNRAMVTEHTIVHELFHFLAHPRFGRELKPKVVEGFTEYFTYKIIGAAGSAAAATAATGDDNETHVSGYTDFTRNVQATRDFLKNTVFKFIKKDRDALPASGFLGRERAPGFQPHEYAGVVFKNFTKRAYFKGDPQMIQFIKDQSGW